MLFRSFLSSGTPVKIAEICTKARSVSAARSRAMVVLPTPGGPHRISEDKDRAASIAPKGPSAPNTCSWPMTSDRLRGRSRSASGRGASGAGWAAAVSKRSAMRPRLRPDVGGGKPCRQCMVWLKSIRTTWFSIPSISITGPMAFILTPTRSAQRGHVAARSVRQWVAPSPRTVSPSCAIS